MGDEVTQREEGRKPVAKRPGTGRRDHRTRVGRLRSARTQSRILHAALRVFAEKGPDAPVVDDFVRAAGVSRGTFYNHFDDVEQLLEATSVWTTGHAVVAIDDAIQDIDDRAVRFGTGIRLFLSRAHSDPVWSLFVARVWKLGPLDAPVRVLEEGLRDGVFRFPDVGVALDVVLGGMREALLEIGSGRKPEAYVRQVVQLCLQALGVAPGRIAAVLRRDLPVLDPAAPPVPVPRRPSRNRRKVRRAPRA